MEDDKLYEGPERRVDNRVNYLHLVHAVKSLEDRVESTHRRNKENCERIDAILTRLSESINAPRTGILGRIQTLEEHADMREKLVENKIKGISNWIKGLYAFLSFLFIMQGWTVMSLLRMLNK